MTLFDHIPEDQAQCRVPPNIVAGLTGVIQIQQRRDGETTLMYSDYSTESVAYDEDIRAGSFFHHVSQIQHYARDYNE